MVRHHGQQVIQKFPQDISTVCYGQNDVPAGVTNAVGIASGYYHSMALLPAAAKKEIKLIKPTKALVAPSGPPCCVFLPGTSLSASLVSCRFLQG